MACHHSTLAFLQLGRKSKKSIEKQFEKGVSFKTKERKSNIPVYIVDAMKVLRMIPAIDLSPPTYETWEINVFTYMNGLPGLVCHVVFDIYPDHVDFSRPSKGRYNSIGERRYISSLSQQLPLTHKAWLDYLSSSSSSSFV